MLNTHALKPKELDWVGVSGGGGAVPRIKDTPPLKRISSLSNQMILIELTQRLNSIKNSIKNFRTKMLAVGEK